MKRILASVMVVLVLCSCCAFAESSIDLSKLSYNELLDLCHQVIDELTSRPEWAAETFASSEGRDRRDTNAEDNIVDNVEHVFVKNYIGNNLSACGYTSLGGERRDRYGSSNTLLVLISTDGTYIDPNNDNQLESYNVIGQMPSPNAEFDITTSTNSKMVNMGYGEILLFVEKIGSTNNIIPQVEYTRPSPNKFTQYVRDYTSRTLEDVGYTALNGKRYDIYGPSGYVQIIIMSEEGSVLNPTDYDNFKYYTVLSQNIAPDTEISFTYTSNEEGKETVSYQSIESIQITVALSEIGQKTLDAITEEEEALKASGLLSELYKGTYEVGKDIPSGNYIISPITSSSNIYTYIDKDALNNKDGQWEYIHGNNDKAYYTLLDGSFITIDSGAVKALRSEFTSNASEFELFEGVFHIGDEIESGKFEFTLVSDSCSINVYEDKDAFEDSDGDWIFLYGDGDVEFITLKDGMVLKISDGAVKVKRK